MSNNSSMLGMMGRTASTAPVPTQTFGAANIVGTAVPQVGNQAARPNYAPNVGGDQNAMFIIGIAIGLILLGFLLHWWHWEA